ncbi:Transmembrane 9 super member 2 [Saccharomyces pastorianus]|nr:Transmembrane 9 super member 2 [Saccharomyces pastorianus]
MKRSVWLLIYCYATLTKGFSLPGLSPTTYHSGDEIPLLVNRLTPSIYFQHQDEEGNDVSGDKEHFLYSYDYYNKRFHFCRPEHVEKQPESLGSVIFGDRIYNSPFQLNMLEEKECVALCKSTIPGKDAKFINTLIKSGFFQNWLVDGLPAARKAYDSRTKTNYYGTGFELGFTDVKQTVDGKAVPSTMEELTSEASNEDVILDARQPKNVKPNLVKTVELPYFVNHFDIEVEFHDRGNDNYRVVGVIVNPVSIERSSPGACSTTGKPLILDEDKDNEVYFTYSVKFVASDTV